MCKSFNTAWVCVSKICIHLVYCFFPFPCWLQFAENHSEKEIVPQPWDGKYVSYVWGLEITQITKTQKQNKLVFLPGVSVSLKHEMRLKLTNFYNKQSKISWPWKDPDCYGQGQVEKHCTSGAQKYLDIFPFMWLRFWLYTCTAFSLVLAHIPFLLFRHVWKK